MKTSTEISSAAKVFGEERAIEEYAKAGFDAWDFSMFEMARRDWSKGVFRYSDHPLCGKGALDFARRLKKVGEDNGIHCNQSHAPFPSFPEIYPLLQKAVELTAEAGGNICIIHPVNTDTPEKNAELYNMLLPFAKQYGVRIATENMWNWDNVLDQAAPAACSDGESFNAHLDAVNSEWLVACLDIGHAEMRGLGTSAPEMIKALGPRLKALHIHDNDRWKDSHQLPFSMQIDFNGVVKVLKEIGYDGYFTLEADAYLATVDDKLAGIKALADSARRLADMFDAL